MNHLTWTAQAAITEQRLADRLAEAAAHRLSRHNRTHGATAAAQGAQRTWLNRRSWTRGRLILAGQSTAVTN